MTEKPENKSTYQTLFAYHWHTIRRLMDCTEKVAEHDYWIDPGYGRGSMHDLFYHLLATDHSWREALASGRQTTPPPPDDFPDLAALRAGFAAEEQAWDAYLAGLAPADLEAEINLTTLRGAQFSFVHWRVLQHLILHGMQHQAELAQLLTARGQSPGDIDFIFYR